MEADNFSAHALAVMPWSALFKGTRGSVLVELGWIDEGVTLLRQALNDNPSKQHRALDACYLALAMSGNRDDRKAGRHLRRARRLDPNCTLLGRVEREVEQRQTIASGRGRTALHSEGAADGSMAGMAWEPSLDRHLTDHALRAIQRAGEGAHWFGHEYVGTEHILLGLIKETSGVAAAVLKKLGLDHGKLRAEVEWLVPRGPEMVTMGSLSPTPHAKKVIEYSLEEARSLNQDYVGTEHLLLGLLREEESTAATVLMNVGLNLAQVREEVLNLAGDGIEGGEKSPTG